MQNVFRALFHVLLKDFSEVNVTQTRLPCIRGEIHGQVHGRSANNEGFHEEATLSYSCYCNGNSNSSLQNMFSVRWTRSSDFIPSYGLKRE